MSISFKDDLPVTVAVEPLSTGAILTLVGMIGSVASFIILILKVIFCYGLFVLIIFYIFANVFHLFGGFSVWIWLGERLLGTSECIPIIPP